jgi:hypothetical protein
MTTTKAGALFIALLNSQNQADSASISKGGYR